MKKGMVFVAIGVLILLAAAVVSVGARPDDGLSGGNSRRSSATVWQPGAAGQPPAVCLTHGTDGLQARQDWKDLQAELAMNGNGGASSAPPEFIACAIQNQVSTR